MLRLLDHLVIRFRRRSPRARGRLAYRLLRALVVERQHVRTRGQTPRV